MAKKEKICVPEDAPISETERAYLDELYNIWGDRIKEADLDEMFLVRFIRGYVNEEDPKKAAFDVIDQYLTWAKEINVHKLAATEFPRRREFFSKIWPSGFHGLSKDGHVIYIDRPGKASPKALDGFDMNEYTDMHIQTMEWLNDVKVRLSKRMGKPIYKHVVIFDLEDFGFSHFGEKFRGPMKKLIDIDQSKYPETLSQMYVVNASFMFKAIWAIVSPWLDEITKSRIKFVKKAELKEYIDEHQLPDFLGGTCKYTPEEPCFASPFKSGPGGSGEFDDIFQGLLEDRQAKYQALLAREAAAAPAAEQEAGEAVAAKDEDTPAAAKSQ